jgi:hypothetical protein
MKGNFESLNALATRIEEIENKKEDYLISTNNLRMSDDVSLKLPDSANPLAFAINDLAQGQIVERMRSKLPGIRKEYWDAMPALPGLRTYTVNRWLESVNEKRLIRTLEGSVRAFLSDSFKPWDNIDMLAGLLPVLEGKALQVKSSSLTERRMYLQLVFPSLTAEVKVGEPVRAGITISNSEVGSGAWDVRSFIEVLRCSNGMVAESLIRKYHVGRKTEDSDEGIFRSDTIESDIRTAKLQLRDVIENALKPEAFQKKIALLKDASSQEIAEPVKVCEKITKRFGFSDGQKNQILSNLIKGGDASRYGLSNAVTAMWKSEGNPDQAYELEKAGWDIIALSPSEWNEISK